MNIFISSNFLEPIAYNNSISNIKPSGMDIGLEIGKHHGWKGNNTMPGLRAMFLDRGPNGNIRCRFICDFCRIESHVRSIARLFLEIEKTNPDVVVMDLNLYAKIDGIETSRMIRCQFDVPVMYV